MTAALKLVPSEQISTLRPGLLVVLNTSIQGNISYTTEDLAHQADGGTDVKVWQTERTIADLDEYHAAVKVRSRVQSILRSACYRTAFGMMAPEANAEKLIGAITEARKVADEFNATASLTRVSVKILTGRVAADDVIATQAIAAEIRDLMSDMQTAIAASDVKAIRDAAAKAKQVGEMLSDEAKGQVAEAVKAARAVATKIVKVGEDAKVEIDKATIEKIDAARVAFLDLDDTTGTVADFGITADNRELDL